MKVIKDSAARLPAAIRLLYCIKVLCHSLICITCNLFLLSYIFLEKLAHHFEHCYFSIQEIPLPFTGTFSARQHRDNSSAILLRPAAIYVCSTTTVSVEVVLSSENNLVLSDFCLTMAASKLAQTSHKSHKMLSSWVKTRSLPWILLPLHGEKNCIRLWICTPRMTNQFLTLSDDYWAKAELYTSNCCHKMMLNINTQASKSACYFNHKIFIEALKCLPFSLSFPITHGIIFFPFRFHNNKMLLLSILG